MLISALGSLYFHPSDLGMDFLDNHDPLPSSSPSISNTWNPEETREAKEALEVLDSDSEMDFLDNDDPLPFSFPSISNTWNPEESREAKDALEALDSLWYIMVAKRGRWMDLVGDYAGSERFVLDGEFPVF